MRACLAGDRWNEDRWILPEHSLRLRFMPPQPHLAAIAPQISSIVPFLAAVGFSSPGEAGFVDSPLEGAGFEPPVPLGEATVRDRFASF